MSSMCTSIPQVLEGSSAKTLFSCGIDEGSAFLTIRIYPALCMTMLHFVASHLGLSKGL